MDVSFRAEVFEWRGPAPFYWLRLPASAGAYVHSEAAQATYGWGAIPVRARIGATEWETSLLPRDGGYVLPLKDAVRATEQIADGDIVAVAVSIVPRNGRAANGPDRAR